MTLKQEKELKQQMLLNDLNYIIDNIIINLQYDYNDNLYNVYTYYINNKYELIDKVLNKIKQMQVEMLQEIATQKGFEFKKVLVNKHNIDTNNEYQTRLLIEELIDKRINELIKQFKQQQKTKEYLQDNFINEEENKSPPTTKNDFVVLCNELIKIILIICSCIIAFISGLCKGTKKRR